MPFGRRSPGSSFQLCPHRSTHPRGLLGAQLCIDGQQDRPILGEFGLTQILSLDKARIRLLTMGAHDAAAGCDALIEEMLHHDALVEAVWKTYAIALPV